jgi:predicted PurR-regulated permease PerM
MAPAPTPGPLSTRATARIFLTVAGLAAMLYLLFLVRSVVGLVFIAMFLSVALGPPVDFFARRRLPLVRRLIPRSLAILVVYALIGLSVFGVGLLVVPPIVTQVNSFAAKAPQYLDEVTKNKTLAKYDRRYHVTAKLRQQASKLPAKLSKAAGALRDVTVGVFSALVQLITVLTIAFFLLLDGQRIAGFLFGLSRPQTESRMREIAEDIYRAVSGYVAGNLVISVIAGTTTYVVLSLLGVPFSVPLSVLVAFLDLIPLVGATIGAVLVGIVTLFNDFPTATIVWAIFSLVYQQVENSVIQPIVYKRTVDVHPLVVIISILIGAALLGVLGALVAIPVAGALQIVVRDLWRRRKVGGIVLLDDDGEVEEASSELVTPG